MTEKEEKQNIELYRQYGISEWYEKCHILTVQEQNTVLDDLASNRETELTALIRLPFPHFVTQYMADFKCFNTYFKDPTFSYKLFFMTPPELRYFTERLRNPTRKREEIIALYGLPKKVYQNSILSILIETRLEDLPKIMSKVNSKRVYEKKFAYLTQYIDVTEARRLKLSLANTLERDGVANFDMEGKIAMLNPTTREMMICYLGLYGHASLTKEEIKRRLHFDKDPDGIFQLTKFSDKLIDLLFRFFARPAGELKNYLGYNEKNDIPGNMHEYSKGPARQMMLYVETQHILQSLPKKVKQHLKTHYTSNEIMTLLAAKYMYKTPESLARNLVLSIQEAESVLAKVAKSWDKFLKDYEEDIANMMCYTYGITEWPEKNCILSADERLQLQSDLKKGRTTDLTELASLPWPRFIERYFAQLPSKHPYFEDPTFAYKLFFIRPSTLRYFTERLRNPHVVFTKIAHIYNIPLNSDWQQEIDTFEQVPLENLPKIRSSHKERLTNVIKFLYLSQYIDMDEVERLGLPSRELFLKDGVDGYDLQGKLACLNPAIRQIVKLYLGIGHPKSRSVTEIIKLKGYKGHDSNVYQAINFLIPILHKPLGEFKYLIGFVDERQEPDNMFSYVNKKYRRCDLFLETWYRFAFLTSIEQEVLMKKTANERMIYLASRFMYHTPEALAYNLTLSLADAEKRLRNTKLI